MMPSSGLSPVNQIKLLAHQISTTVLDLLFPPVCVNCERVGSFLCARCLETITESSPRQISRLDGVVTCAEFDGAIRAGVHGLKYEGLRRLAEPLGALIAHTLQQAGWSIDQVCSVPMHTERLRERGYNQAHLLAQHVAVLLSYPLAENALQRTRHTASQIHLDAQERQANVAGAFLADANVVHGRSVLIIDDVLTTGATLVACADALRAAGATRVYGATVAGANRGQDKRFEEMVARA